MKRAGTIDHRSPRRETTRAVRDAPSGQAIVEFALVSLLFFSMIFGTIDFGRAIYLSNQLHNAVRDGARYGKLYPAETSTIKSTVVAKANGFSLTASNVTVTCVPSPCSASSTRVTVSASAPFTAITQTLLGISPITMKVSSSVNVE
jgi:Flp pilus assembly protein TadG